MLAVPLILAAVFISYFFLAAPIPDHPPASTESGQNPQEAAGQDATAELEIARLRAEARRNALTTGAGFVAIGALILALRRQQHLEQATANTEDDALQRRITDARIRAVEQLGSDNPAIRIGGLHNLERIGQQHAELRQVVLDEICSYLRLPFPLPGSEVNSLSDRQFEPIGPPPAKIKFDQAEYEVRLIAQEILQRHLNPDSERLYWEHSRLNLRNAHLDGIVLNGCHLTHADFRKATFTGDADFGRVTFTGDANFGRVTFTGNAYFVDTTFTGNAYFGRAAFTSEAYFGDVTFTGEAHFWGVTFTGNAGFWDVTFTGGAYFERVSFTGDADFEDATFTGSAYFRCATFAHTADFASFARARFHGPVWAENPILLGLLQEQSVLLDIEEAHKLPDGWSVEPNATDPEWGCLVRTAGSTSVIQGCNVSDGLP